MFRETTVRQPRSRKPTPPVEAPATQDDAESAPVGTLFLMVLFLAAIAGLWGTVYWMLLTR